MESFTLQLKRLLLAAGCEFVRHGKGDHEIWRSPVTRVHFVVRALAKMMGRNYSNVHADVRRLIEHGLIEKDAGDHILVPWDDVVVRMDASLMRLAA